MVSVLIYLIIVMSIGGRADNTANFQQQKGAHWDDGMPDFKLETTFKVFRTNSTSINSIRRWTEYYSSAKGRAKLKFHPDRSTDDDELIEYYYDGNQLLKHKTTALRTTCDPALMSNLPDDLFGAKDIAGASLWSETRGTNDQVPNYLIGLTRLAYIVNTKRDQFEPIHQSKQYSTSIHNLDTIGYKLKLNFGQANYDMFVYYAASPWNPLEGPGDMPMRVWILIDTDNAIMVDYYGMRPIDYNGQLVNEVEEESLFMFPVGLSCSDRLKNADFLDGGLPVPRVASFRASLEHYLYSSELKRYFVAYDGYARTLRTDTISISDETDYTITIVDLNRQRKYNVKQPVTSLMCGERQVQTDKASMGAQCVISRFPIAGPGVGLAPLEPILPYNSLVEMGPATVRGVHSVVFEQVTELLPVMLFPPVSFIDTNGKERAINDPDQSARTANGESTLYTIVYYFASQFEGNSTNTVLQCNGEPLGPLLRVDVLKRDKLAYRIEIEEFVWQLADAPNGDKAYELFSVNTDEKCLSSSRSDRGETRLRSEDYATLNLGLEINLVSQREQFDSAERLLKILANPEERNTGLVRALTGLDTKGLAATQIRSIESKLHQISPTRVLINLVAKLSQPSHVDLYEAVSVGYGYQLESSLPYGSIDLDGCYWEALHKRKRERGSSGELVFSYYRNTCKIDKVASIGANNTIEGGFFIPNIPCQVFRVATINDDTERASREHWTIISESLHRGPLKITILNRGARPHEILAEARNIEIGSDRWSSQVMATDGARDSAAQTSDDKQVLEGVGLTLGANGVKRVQPKRSEEESELVTDLLPQTEMSYAICHSSCLASPDCRSFSLCSNGADQLECLVSDLAFRDPDILNQIARKSAAARDGAKKRQQSITLDIARLTDEADLSDEDESEVAGTKNSVELKVDKRCHIYNKRALELFSPAKRTALYGLKDNTLMAADSEDECGELCLKRNMLLLKRSAKTRKMYLEHSASLRLDADGDEEEGGFLARIRAREERSLRIWCDSFAFIDGNIVSEHITSIRDLNPSKLTKRGLCYLPMATRNGTESYPKSESTKIIAHSYEFTYASLYEHRQGIKLQASLSSLRGSGVDLSKLTPDEVRKFLSEQNNQAFLALSNPEACARACFLQTVKIRPWCKSFGFTEYITPITRSNNTTATQRSSHHLCIFNSNTITQALRGSQSKQLVSQVPNNIAYFHYEPHISLSLDDLEFTQNSIERDKRIDLDNVKLSAIGIGILLALAVASGLALGIAISVLLTRKISSRRESHLGGLIGGADFHIPHQRFDDVNIREIDLPELPDRDVTDEDTA